MLLKESCNNDGVGVVYSTPCTRAEGGKVTAPFESEWFITASVSTEFCSRGVEGEEGGEDIVMVVLVVAVVFSLLVACDEERLGK